MPIPMPSSLQKRPPVYRGGGPYGGINPQPAGIDPSPKMATSSLGGSQYGPQTGINPVAPGQSQIGTGAGIPGQSGPYGGINPGGSAGSAPQSWNQQQGTEYFQNWLQGRYGRRATGQEMSQIASGIGYGGGDISGDLMQRAQSYADNWARGAGLTANPASTPGLPYTPGPGTAPPSTPQSPDDPNQAALQARIQEMLATNTGDVNTGSQEYQSQLGAFQRAQQRGLERAKRSAANRAAMGGTAGSGGYEAAQTGLDLEAANQAGNFEAQLANQQIGRQREDVQTALQLAQQAGLSNESRQLQERLANLDANFRQQGLNLRGELGRGDMDLRRYLGRGQLGLGLLSALLNDRQASNALGFNYASLQNIMDQQALSQILGAL